MSLLKRVSTVFVARTGTYYFTMIHCTCLLLPLYRDFFRSMHALSPVRARYVAIIRLVMLMRDVLISGWVNAVRHVRVSRFRFVSFLGDLPSSDTENLR